MIKPEDLRIGNWVMYDNRYFQIDSIAEPFPTLRTIEFGIGVVDWNNMNPIPLTERILLDSKFEHHKQIDKCYIITNDIVISFADDKIRVICGNFICQVVVTEIKSIHEFQNTIYSLTKTELIINL